MRLALWATLFPDHVYVYNGTVNIFEFAYARPLQFPPNTEGRYRNCDPLTLGINVSGTFYYRCGVLDGYSRSIVHWDLRESMTEAEIEVILEKAREKYPEAKPQIVSDNGPQFIARDFKEFIRIAGMTHMLTSPGYPQSNDEAGALAQIAEVRVHPARRSADQRRCFGSDSHLRGLLHRPFAQCYRLCDAARHTCWESC